MVIKVKVNKEDIEKGKHRANATCGCPVYLALKRELEELGICGRLSIEDVSEGHLGKLIILLPEQAIDFQEALMEDVNAAVEPFEFDLQLVVPE